MARRHGTRNQKGQSSQTKLRWSTVCINPADFSQISQFIRFRPGGFGARDYRNPAQLRNNRGGGGGNRPGGSASGYNNHQQQWDASNGGGGGNMWAGDHQSTGYDRYPQQTGAGNGNRQQDHSWWDSTS